MQENQQFKQIMRFLFIKPNKKFEKKERVLKNELFSCIGAGSNPKVPLRLQPKSFVAESAPTPPHCHSSLFIIKNTLVNLNINNKYSLIFCICCDVILMLKSYPAIFALLKIIDKSWVLESAVLVLVQRLSKPKYLFPSK